MRELILENAATISFFAPEAAYADARTYLPALLEKRGVAGDAVLNALAGVAKIVQPVDLAFYAGMQQAALQRIAVRDAGAWPVLACAMTLGCPVWTEDADFFGTGVATWTTDRIDL